MQSVDSHPMTDLASRTIRPAAVLAILALLLLGPTAVSAHAELDIATPADGAEITGSPPEVSGTFTQDVDPDGSSLQLRDEAGDVIATGGVDPDDPRRMVIADLPDLAPGEYEVRWTTISAEDDELARDRWSFTVIAAPTPSPAPTPTATAAPTSTPSSVAPSAPASAAPSTAPSPSPSDATGEPAAGGSDALLPIIAGLAVVVIVAGLLLRRRNRVEPPA